MGTNAVKERTSAETSVDEGLEDSYINRILQDVVGKFGLTGESGIAGRLPHRRTLPGTISAGPPDAKPRRSNEIEDVDAFLERVERELGQFVLDPELATRTHAGTMAMRGSMEPVNNSPS